MKEVRGGGEEEEEEGGNRGREKRKTRKDKEKRYREGGRKRKEEKEEGREGGRKRRRKGMEREAMFCRLTLSPLLPPNSPLTLLFLSAESMNDFEISERCTSVITKTSLRTNTVNTKTNLWDVFTPELDLMNKLNCTHILLSPDSSGFSKMYNQKPWSATNLIVQTAYN